MGNLPTRFWMAQGFGIDSEHKVNAYDNALYHMGLADQNMRYVSSVPPNTQVFDVLTRKGYTYIPPPEGEYPKAEYNKWVKLRQIVKPVDIPEGAPDLYPWYFYMGTSWCTDVVMTDMRGDAGERISAALGIGKYQRHDGSVGVFAFESHGYISPEDCADNAIEGLDKMINMRGHEPIDRVQKMNDEVKEYDLAEIYDDLTGGHRMRRALKGVYHSTSHEMTAYVTSMIVPESYCGAVLTGCVFDPFTEISSGSTF